MDEAPREEYYDNSEVWWRKCIAHTCIILVSGAELRGTPPTGRIVMKLASTVSIFAGHYSWIFCFFDLALFIHQRCSLGLAALLVRQMRMLICLTLLFSVCSWAVNQWAWDLISGPNSFSSNLIVVSRTCYTYRRWSFWKKYKVGHAFLANPLPLA